MKKRLLAAAVAGAVMLSAGAQAQDTAAPGQAGGDVCESNTPESARTASRPDLKSGPATGPDPPPYFLLFPRGDHSTISAFGPFSVT